MFIYRRIYFAVGLICQNDIVLSNEGKLVFWVSDKARLKPVSSAAETAQKLKFAYGNLRYDTFQKMKKKELISLRGCTCWFAPLFVHKGPYNINTF